MCLFFSLDPTNEMSEDSTKFFEFFLAFFKKADASLPAKVKKSVEKAIKQKVANQMMS